MIKSVYVDNYKCLVNFRCDFDPINLILGVNGNGKSTVFDALRDVRDFVTGRSPIGLFKDATLTRWQARNMQVFDITIAGNSGLYKYHLEIEHEIGKDKQRVSIEEITFDGRPLYQAHLGEVQLYRDDYTAGPSFSGNWSQSGLAFLGEREDNTRVTWLKRWFKEKLLYLQIDPLNMKAMAGATDVELDVYASNFVGWYRHRISSNMAATLKLYDVMSDMYENFGGLILSPEGGDILHLYAQFGVQEDIHGRMENPTYSFSELSSGEKCLFVLYTLLQLMDDADMTLCIDEPDNFVSLGEIQPWCISLRDKIDSCSSQALLISHHPELINYFAPSCGLIFERIHNGRTRVRRFEARADQECLPPSEIVARGWE